MLNKETLTTEQQALYEGIGNSGLFTLAETATSYAGVIPNGCEYCRHHQYAGVKCPECGTVTVKSQRGWRGLTSAERDKIVDDHTYDYSGYDIWTSGDGVARAVEAKLKEMNYGE